MSSGLVSIILPAYNERENLKVLIPSIAESLAGRDIEILLVDDNSPDGSRDFFRSAAIPYLKIVDRTGPRGFALSIRDGLEASRGDIVVIMDSDFNHQPKYLPIMIDNLRHYDMVVASRFQYGSEMDGWLRHKCSWVFNIVTRMLTGGFITDHLYGFLAFHRRVLEGVDPDRVFWGYGDYCIRLLYFLQRKRISILQIPAVNGRRLFGESNLRALKVLAQYSVAVLKLVLTERNPRDVS